MKITVKRNTLNIEFSLEQFTQLCGTNIKDKEYVIDSLDKYFSTSKYQDYDAKYIDNILVDEEDVGRKYFETAVIRNRSDILNLLKITKTSRLKKHIEILLHESTCQEQLFAIENALNIIFNGINENLMYCDSMLNLEYEPSDIFEIVQKSDVRAQNDKYLEELTNYELLDELIKLLNAYQQDSGVKLMLIIDNIDHLIDKNEYEVICEKLLEAIKKSDLWIIISTTLDGYAYITRYTITGITCINDIVYNMPTIDELMDFLGRHYPMYMEFCEDDIFKMMTLVIQHVGKDEYAKDYRADILLKLINVAEGMKQATKIELNNPEISFLMRKDMVK